MTAVVRAAAEYIKYLESRVWEVEKERDDEELRRLAAEEALNEEQETREGKFLAEAENDEGEASE